MRIRLIRPDTEGRSASRSAFDEGGRYLGIPRNRTVCRLTAAQGTGTIEGTRQAQAGRGASPKPGCRSIGQGEAGCRRLALSRVPNLGQLAGLLSRSG